MPYDENWQSIRALPEFFKGPRLKNTCDFAAVDQLP